MLFASLFLAGPMSLVISPLPPSFVTLYALVGGTAGALWLLEEQFFGFLGLGVFLFGMDAVTAAYSRRFFPATMPWWQPAIITIFAVMCVQLFSADFRAVLSGGRSRKDLTHTEKTRES